MSIPIKKLISYTRSANKLVEAIKSITKGINNVTAKYLPALNLCIPGKAAKNQHLLMQVYSGLNKKIKD